MLVRKDHSEERDQQGLLTCLRPQSKQEQGQRTLEGHTQEEKVSVLSTKDSCEHGSKPLPSGPLLMVNHRCSSHGLGTWNPHLFRGWGWLWAIMLEESPSMPQLGSQPCV